jgi:hypothetical protein
MFPEQLQESGGDVWAAVEEWNNALWFIDLIIASAVGW